MKFLVNLQIIRIVWHLSPFVVWRATGFICNFQQWECERGREKRIIIIYFHIWQQKNRVENCRIQNTRKWFLIWINENIYYNTKLKCCTKFEKSISMVGDLFYWIKVIITGKEKCVFSIWIFKSRNPSLYCYCDSTSAVSVFTMNPPMIDCCILNSMMNSTTIENPIHIIPAKWKVFNHKKMNILIRLENGSIKEIQFETSSLGMLIRIYFVYIQKQ